ncbi:hypothetical protein ASG25_13735 [Rhizobium sp. Leaf384]|uniref:hypothetical protein n=1 Tax=unclassified Rhizobium TaxID=2613769 RepID=UPI00071376EC|nr:MULTISPECIES: hypothetical protein [unclassified Rhizobium]KQS77655.1 hypothetical protein ASG25_13735 [Rhizobium sp. Leaf384]KQS84568.1 hypothetical protein ASG58_20805 [Rhizobium sp. Leaf383]
MTGFSGASRRIDLLPPERARPVRPASRVLRPVDVVDAVFEVVPFSRSPAPRATPPSSTPRQAGERRAGPVALAERTLQRISPRRFAGLTMAVCVAAFTLATALVPTKPQAAPALGFGDVRTELQDAAGLKVVAVYGTVVNPTSVARAVPAIRVDVAASGRRMTAEGQLAGDRLLAPGESRAFSARLPHAGGSAPIVQISFGPTGASPR